MRVARRLPAVVFLALLPGLSGCPFGGVTRLNRVPEATALAEPRLIDRAGPFTHEPTGLTFEESYGPFQRVVIAEYDDRGLNASIGYNSDWPGCRVAATFYLYPAPRMSFIGANPSVVASLHDDWLRWDFEANVEALHASHPDLRGGQAKSVSTPILGSSARGWAYRFQFDENLSELRLFLLDGQWFLKQRLTYPRSCGVESEQRIAALLPRLPWATAR